MYYSHLRGASAWEGRTHEILRNARCAAAGGERAGAITEIHRVRNPKLFSYLSGLFRELPDLRDSKSGLSSSDLIWGLQADES